jgi:hypothetical protein
MLNQSVESSFRHELAVAKFVHLAGQPRNNLGEGFKLRVDPRVALFV